MFKETILEVYFDFPRHGILKVCSGQIGTLQNMIFKLEHGAHKDMLWNVICDSHLLYGE